MDDVVGLQEPGATRRVAGWSAFRAFRGFRGSWTSSDCRPLEAFVSNTLIALQFAGVPSLHSGGAATAFSSTVLSTTIVVVRWMC
ncbi:MAG: hypothetical protein LC620_01600, partial [Halobacteriales archaeon]|nr:hypothetical protein [Halobacteriales archaeon]